MCEALPNRPGLLCITAFAPWPKAYSPSKFHTYRRCPRQYFLQDELGLRTKPESQNSAQQRGLLVHAWLEQAHKRSLECSKEDLPTNSSLGVIATAATGPNTSSEIILASAETFPKTVAGK